MAKTLLRRHVQTNVCTTHRRLLQDHPDHILARNSRRDQRAPRGNSLGEQTQVARVEVIPTRPTFASKQLILDLPIILPQGESMWMSWMIPHPVLGKAVQRFTRLEARPQDILLHPLLLPVTISNSKATAPDPYPKFPRLVLLVVGLQVVDPQIVELPCPVYHLIPHSLRLSDHPNPLPDISRPLIRPMH